MQTNNTYLYSGRPIVDRTPMPDGRMLRLAYGYSVAPWATAFLGEDTGKYSSTHKDEWRDRAKRLAEGHGLTFAPEGSVVVTAEQIELVQTAAVDLSKPSCAFERMPATDNCRAHVCMAAEDDITESAMAMGDVLRDLKLYIPAEPEVEAGRASVEAQQHTVGTFVEAATNGEKWNG
ncbi:hypothetical protein ABT246_24480 [Streptomyces sp. NPDC001553]|uniref:hypothetical protein n=1 Tax=Streptomyces sp. NPDC001553 TaxID=3154385 RepID=UPI00331AFCC6